ncbi:MAG: PD40 domain-containing protein [Anaerolineae bacterium]|nr:PD40 domain-containing protein [Anaerolineae bacterium]
MLTLTAIMALLTLGALWAGGRSATAAVLEYDVFNPAQEAVYFAYADVYRGLTVRLPHPAEVTPFESGEVGNDGRRVIAQQTPGNVDLFVLEGAAAPRQITRFTQFIPRRPGEEARRANTYPRWSPDGALIMFLSSDAVGQVDLYVIRPDGGGLQRVASRIRTRLPERPRWVLFKVDSF